MSVIGVTIVHASGVNGASIAPALCTTSVGTAHSEWLSWVHGQQDGFWSFWTEQNTVSKVIGLSISNQSFSCLAAAE